MPEKKRSNRAIGFEMLKPEDKKKLESIAMKCGLSVSSYVRQLVYQKLND